MCKNEISCDTHDYIEVCCLYKYELNIHKKDKTIINGFANDIVIKNKKNEYLELIDYNKNIIYSALEYIDHINVLTKNAKFKVIDIL